MNARCSIRLAVTTLLGLAWCWSLLRVAIQPGHAGPVERGLTAGGWTLSFLPVHTSTRPRRRIRRAPGAERSKPGARDHEGEPPAVSGRPGPHGFRDRQGPSGRPGHPPEPCGRPVRRGWPVRSGWPARSEWPGACGRPEQRGWPAGSGWPGRADPTSRMGGTGWPELPGQPGRRGQWAADGPQGESETRQLDPERESHPLPTPRHPAGAWSAVAGWPVVRSYGEGDGDGVRR